MRRKTSLVLAAALFGVIGMENETRAGVILSTDFTGVDTSAAPTATNIPWIENGVSLAGDDLTFSGTLKAGGSYTPTFISTGSPANNIQVGGNIETQGPWSTSFTLTPDSDLQLENFTLDFRAISATGGNQSQSKSATYTLAVTQGSTTIGSFSDRVTDPGGGTAAGDTADIELTGVQLSANLPYTFTLTVSSTATPGNNVAIDNLALNGASVPEPAGIGFLATGLAALSFFGRRRRTRRFAS